LVAEIEEFFEPVTPADAACRHDRLNPFSCTNIVCAMNFANKTDAGDTPCGPTREPIPKRGPDARFHH